MSNLYHSYFDTVASERKSLTKRDSSNLPRKQQQQQQDPPKRLSKTFTRQLAKTLANPKKPLKKKKNSTKRKRTIPAKMPKRAAAESYDSDGGFVEDAPKSKKNKGGGKAVKEGSGNLPEREKDKDGVFWEISGKRRLQLSEFRGTTMVGVREYYEKDGQQLPGKKGISMNIDQFNTIIELLPQLESELEAKGVKLARPKYDQAANVVTEDTDDEEEEAEEEPKAVEKEEEIEEEIAPKESKSKLDKFKHKAKNHEATSDEDEG